MPAFPDTVLADPEAAKYVDGIGIHWYADGNVNTSVLDTTHTNHPNKFMLYTEACNHCCGNGDWARGDSYVHNIMEDLNHWVAGWTDWNMCLSTTGGPNWVNNFEDAPIIVNATVDEFYKQPMYYAMGHLSKFIVENSVRVQLDTHGITSNVLIESVAFQTPLNQRVLVINNRNVNTNYAVTVRDASMQGHLTLNLEARSFTTIVWNSPN
uniref:Glucosylceramidase n=1 Tax=Acrobeloides nanus TaxID=290746 RepID=A0A914CGK1_9BILA